MIRLNPALEFYLKGSYGMTAFVQNNELKDFNEAGVSETQAKLNWWGFVAELKKYGLNLNKTDVDEIIRGSKPAFQKVLLKVKKWESKNGLLKAFSLMNKP